MDRFGIHALISEIEARITASDDPTVKAIKADVQLVEGSQKIFGYASVFGNIDKHGDIVAKGAFVESIARTGQQLPLFFEHAHIYGPAMPVGHTTVLREDDKGLFFEAQIVATREGQDLIKLIEAGSVDEASFAFDILDDEIDGDTGVRTLKRLGLSEVSVVVWGANPETSVSIDGLSSALGLISALSALDHKIAARRASEVHP